MNFLKISVYLSLLIQIFVGIFDFYVVKLKVPNKLIILQQVLLMELIVQIVEAIFYLWLALNIDNVKNITPKRYYDWFLTTPTMLISLCIYLIYLKYDDKNNQINANLFEIIYHNIQLFTIILFLNFIMLLSGYLSEMGKISKISGVFIGFIPFFIYFYLIYTYFAKFTKTGLQLFYYFFVIWFMYGIAALTSYKVKNTMYNILDLFAKNFFGLYLGWVILNNI